MAIHIKDIKKNLDLLKDTQKSLNRVLKIITVKELRDLKLKIDNYLEDIETDICKD
tara:strand:+ start:259 stop:426 length:168 start_codon:yes stop_codon:yes gene_type:complete